MGELVFGVNNISKHFETDKGVLQVLDNIQMDIHEKEFIVILGPSGCGKSTFLKILDGIQPATGGTLQVMGQDCGQQVPRELMRKFGYVFQSNNLLQWRTTEGNLKLMLEMMHLKGDEWERRVDEMLDLVGLLQYKNIYPHELSGGMKQRVGIARALVHDPEVLIFDQPLGALDAITRRMLSYELLKIWQQTQKTIVMVTNSVEEAVLLANRVYVFSALPARVAHVVDIDIPMEKRGEDIVDTPRFNELRAQLTAYVHQTMQGAKGE